MNTRKCSKCGWEYPLDWPGRTCKFCHEPFIGGFCYMCGEWADKLWEGRCTACKTKLHSKWRLGRLADADKQYKEWLESIKKIPYPYKTLTEEQWMEACKHFGGCAYCGSPEIEARSMFIPFKEGGRYCNWNIIPACEKCETVRKSTINPFERMDNMVKRSQTCQAKKLGFTLENLQKIVDYLQSKMEIEQ